MTFKQRIVEALNQSPNIVIGRDEIDTTHGFPVEYFEQLGLSKADLKKLERNGLAIRGYLRHVKSGRFEVRYALLADRRIEDEVSERGTTGDGGAADVGGSPAGSDS